MKQSSIFWGVFLIFFGFFLILDQYGYFDKDLSYVMKLWPLLLVIWGISLLKMPDSVKKIITAISAVLLALFIIALFNNSWCPFYECNEDYGSKRIHKINFQKTINIQYDSTRKFANLQLDGGACEILFAETTDQLIMANSLIPMRYFDIKSTKDSDVVNLTLQMKLGKLTWKNNQDNEVIVKLNQKPIWDFDFNIGAVDFNCDLSKFKVKNIILDAGAADIELIIGSLYDKTNIDINTGASDVEINIPERSGCMITSSTGLSGNDFNGFIRIDDAYYTPNYDKAKQKIVINISGGISNFEVNRN